MVRRMQWRGGDGAASKAEEAGETVLQLGVGASDHSVRVVDVGFLR